jgi:glycosyltransferase involved in cell wall biosynthesis
MKNKELAISIVIPCATDLRLERCLKSINEKVEVIVVLNGATKKVIKIANEYKVKKVIVEERNLPKALNAGIEVAKNQKVLLMDSDCVFHPKAIREIYLALETNLMAKGIVVFQHKGPISKAIAGVRDYTNANTIKAYNPFLGLRKDIKEKIGGYYFDDRIYWTEDADLDQRIAKAKMVIKPVPMAIAYHPPLTLKQDLRSAFKYGVGKRIRVEMKIGRGIGCHFSRIPDMVKTQRFLSGIYYFFWNCSYLGGYFYQIIADPYGTKNI